MISIHALREEGDALILSASSPYLISIHALREEGDSQQVIRLLSLIDFYPRPPRGGRPSWATKRRTHMKFLSTPSARRATRP